MVLQYFVIFVGSSFNFVILILGSVEYNLVVATREEAQSSD